MAPEDHCELCPVKDAAISANQKKIEANCRAIVKLHERVDKLASLQTHLEYLRASIDSIKAEHRAAIIEMKHNYKQAIEEARAEWSGRISWMEKLVYAIFTIIILGSFAKFITSVGISG